MIFVLQLLILTRLGISESCKLKDVGVKIKEYNQMPKLSVEGVKYNTEAPFDHKASVRLTA